ncbi:MAG: diaminopimelate epimerase [Elusimicrobia bacterium]|nr:diaminopimelate epimerase [Elusimicrobiota bacterium]
MKIFKYSATGNTFVLVDGRSGRRRTATGGPGVPWISAKGGGLRRPKQLPILAQKLSQEFNSDGIIYIDSAGFGRQKLIQNQQCDLQLIFFNPDGTRAFCGNGTRTAGFYEIAERRHGRHGKVRVATDEGTMIVEVFGSIARLRGIPLPLSRGRVTLDAGAKYFEFEKIWSGCPHAVTWVKRLFHVDVKENGSFVRNHRNFRPKGTNVDFVERTGRGGIAVRTYERGVERETLSCGSGVLAVAQSARERGLWKGSIKISTPGGFLQVIDEGKSWSLGGAVKKIFEGQAWIE